MIVLVVSIETTAETINGIQQAVVEMETASRRSGAQESFRHAAHGGVQPGHGHDGTAQHQHRLL